MPKVPRAYADARRTQIVEAASQLVAEKGFEAPQMREIAERAGLSTGALYQYFASKEELIRAVADSLRPAEAAFVKQVLGDGSPAERLQALPSKFVEIAESSDKRSRRNFRHYGEAANTPFLAEMLREVVTDTADELEILVHDAQAEGVIDPDLDPRMTATALTTMMISVDFARLFDERFDGAQLAETLRAMISGLRR